MQPTRLTDMTQILVDNPPHLLKGDMAHSTASQQAVELPRYRGRKSNAQATGEPAERYESFDSTYSSTFANEIPGSPDSTDLRYSAELTTTTSLLDKPVIRKLVFRRHWFHTDMTIYTAHLNSNPTPELLSSTISPPTPTPEAETPVYHLETTLISLVKPDITMYAGPKPDAAHVLAVAHFRWSRNARLGFGADAVDPDSNPNGVVWEELRNTSSYLLHYSYEFSVPTTLPSSKTPVLSHSTPSHLQTQTPLRRTFKLLRTHSPTHHVAGWTGSLSYRNYLLIDLDAHETIGVFLADNLRSLTKKGELRLFKALGKEVEVGVVLALGVVSEKGTRRERAGKGGGGG